MNLAGTAGFLLQHYGYLAVFVLPMLESTGLPVPGETMLLTASVYAATTGRLSIVGVITAAAAGAIVGDNLGYLIGRRGGRALALRFGRYVGIREKQLHMGERFFARHGAKAVFLARFITILRTIGAFLAGVSRMPYGNFLVFNAAGGTAWALVYGLLAYSLGRQFARYQVVITRSGVVLAVVGAILVAVFLIFGHDRFQRWALGEGTD